MKTSFKKIVAGASLLALVAMNALTNVNGANANPTLTGTVSTDNQVAVSEVVTVTIPNSVIAENADSVNVYVRNQAGAGVDVSTWSIGNEANATLDLTNQATGGISLTNVVDAGVDVTFEVTPDAEGNYTFSVIGTAGVGSDMLYVGTANQVTVTAVVLPILSMALSTSSLDFGELDPTTPTTVNLDITTASNAAGGVTIAMTSNGLRTGNTANDYVIGNKISDVADLEVPTTGSDTYKVISSSTNGGTILDNGLGAPIDVADDQNILVATNVAEANNVTNVALTADIDNQTEAGNYTDTLTFTVTGTF